MKLTVGNSLCKIEGYNQEQFKELRALLSYTSDPKAQFYAGFRGSNRKYLITKRGDFPTGLLFMVLEWAAGKPLELVDQRVRPKSKKGMFKLVL